MSVSRSKKIFYLFQDLKATEEEVILVHALEADPYIILT